MRRQLNVVIRRRLILSRLAQCEQESSITGGYLGTLVEGCPEWFRAWDEHQAAMEAERKVRRALARLRPSYATS